MSDARAPVLCAEGLRVVRGGRPIVDTLDLALHAGEIVGLLGPNGAGKSTTFGVLAGDVRPDAGRVTFRGADITSWPLHRRARAGLGYLPQGVSFLEELDVAGNLEVAREHAEAPPPAAALLGRVGLDGCGARDVRTLSGGERKRLAIARCLALGARVLVLDEPFAGVDPVAVDALSALLRALATEGCGVLLTDHAVAATLDACDRVVLIDAGTVLCAGTPAVVRADPRARARYLGAR
ncbi:MAG: hypothetical protein RLZZ299_1661 [Pseudomonadota bacterium]